MSFGGKGRAVGLELRQNHLFFRLTAVQRRPAASTKWQRQGEKATMSKHTGQAQTTGHTRTGLRTALPPSAYRRTWRLTLERYMSSARKLTASGRFLGTFSENCGCCKSKGPVLPPRGTATKVSRAVRCDPPEAGLCLAHCAALSRTHTPVAVAPEARPLSLAAEKQTQRCIASCYSRCLWAGMHGVCA